MSYKIYLVTHLDRNKKYVGITSKDLHQRWYQHMKDKASALHPDIATESHRMTMELISETETKQEALQMESELIQELGTEVPNGYNRQVRKEEKPKELVEVEMPLAILLSRKHSDIFMSSDSVLHCPVCDFPFTHLKNVTVWARPEDCTPNTVLIETQTGHIHVGNSNEGNPSSRRDGLSMLFYCENGEHTFIIDIAQHKGETFADVRWNIEEDAS
jgi:predicted GIY-YIG superfamily endonuclease